MATTSSPSNLTVIVPLFPRHPGLRHALATLRAQTVRPDLVVFLDDGKTAGAAEPGKEVPGVPVQVVQVDTTDVADAINRAVDFLDHSKYIAIIGAGGAYAPQRLERCLAAIEDPSRFRQPGIVRLLRATSVMRNGRDSGHPAGKAWEFPTGLEQATLSFPRRIFSRGVLTFWPTHCSRRFPHSRTTPPYRRGCKDSSRSSMNLSSS